MATPSARRVLSSFATFGHGITEFAQKPNGTWWNGTCTWAALECCLAATEDRPPSVAQMAAIAEDAFQRGLCSSNGAATLANVAYYARHISKKSIYLEWDYQEPLRGDWHKELLDNAGVRPILMQIAYGLRLRDAETHIRDEAAVRGLRYHAIAIVGKQPDGYVCCDGDHPQVSRRFQVYRYASYDPQNKPIDSLMAATPCGLLILDMPGHM